MVKPNKYYTKLNVVSILDISLFSTDNEQKYPWEDFVITPFHLSQKPTQELETVLFGALMP